MMISGSKCFKTRKKRWPLHAVLSVLSGFWAARSYLQVCTLTVLEDVGYLGINCGGRGGLFTYEGITAP